VSAAQDGCHTARLARFRAANPHVAILVKQAIPAAWADGRKLITAPDVGGLLDKLEQMYPASSGDDVA
jgi:hypothetical protein